MARKFKLAEKSCQLGKKFTSNGEGDEGYPEAEQNPRGRGRGGNGKHAPAGAH